MSTDAVDGIVEQWARERPGMPVDSIGVVARILRIAKLVNDERRRVLTELGIDSATLDLLATLRRGGPPYRMSPADIAASCLVSGGAITQRVARAEEAGLVSSERTPSGRRTMSVALTPRGHEVIEHNIETLLSRERELVSGLPEDQRHQLEALLRTLLATMPGDPAVHGSG